MDRESLLTLTIKCSPQVLMLGIGTPAVRVRLCDIMISESELPSVFSVGSSEP